LEKILVEEAKALAQRIAKGRAGSGEPRDHCFVTPSRLSSKQKGTTELKMQVAIGAVIIKIQFCVFLLKT